jgi:hypothetical protein
VVCSGICDEFSLVQAHEESRFAPREELKTPRPAEQEVERVNVGLAFRDAR